MAYNEHLAERIASVLQKKKVKHEVKNMMGGLCYMVDDKMCFGIHFDKKRQTDLLMARVGEAAYPDLLKKEGCEPMDFTGRPMKGYVFVRPEGFDMDDDLEEWLQHALDFNPQAPRSKKK
ncbi:MAG: TfoX/Sxy family protein [Saprospiraceae bacterium]|nr:TfoX/Sxy family protein [Saprospiraceae bacterium]